MVFAKDPEKDYLHAHSTPMPVVLEEVERQAFLKTCNPGLLTGPYTGRFLKMVSHMIRPANVLEIGTFTGYSAICLAAGLKENGTVTTIEADREKEQMINVNIKTAGLEKSVKSIIGDALEILPGLQKTFDLIFIDGNKIQNQLYFDAVFPKLRAGGIILVDNALWYGKVASDARDRDSESIRAFNKRIQNDPRVENILLPVGDGLLLIRKL